MLVAARGKIAQQQARNVDLQGASTNARAEIERLTAIIAAFQRHRFGARSEQLHPDQLALALEELDAAVARVRAGLDASSSKPAAPGARDTNRGRLPAHLERFEQIVDLDNKACACCGGDLHMIGEDVPSVWMSCRHVPRAGDQPSSLWLSCLRGRVHPGARAGEGGLPTEALIAHMLVAKYADHQRYTGRHKSTLGRASRSIGPPLRTGLIARRGG